MKKLVICGCSFMTSTFWLYQYDRGSDWPIEFPYTEILPEIVNNEIDRLEYIHSPSFVDYFARDRKLQQINLANCGSSNFQIRLQIEQAIKFNPDYVIVGATMPGRCDYPGIPFDYKKLIRNYDNRHSSILGDFLNVLADSDPMFVYDSVDKQTYTKNHVNNMIFNLQETWEYCQIQSGLNLLKNKKIPFVFIPGPLRGFDWLGYDTLWPNNANQPWDYYNKRSKIKSINHCSIQDHNEFLATLKEITPTWN